MSWYYLKCLRCNEQMEGDIVWRKQITVEGKSQWVNDSELMYPSFPMIARMWKLYNESCLYLKHHDEGELNELERIGDWVSFHHQHPIVILDNNGNVCTEAIEYLDDHRLLQLVFVTITPEQQAQWDALPLDRRTWSEVHKKIQFDLVRLDNLGLLAKSKAMHVAHQRGLVPNLMGLNPDNWIKTLEVEADENELVQAISNLHMLVDGATVDLEDGFFKPDGIKKLLGKLATQISRLVDYKNKRNGYVFDQRAYNNALEVAHTPLYHRISRLSDNKVIKLTEGKLREGRLSREYQALFHANSQGELSEAQALRYDKLIESIYHRRQMVKATAVLVARLRGILDFDKFPSLKENG